LFVWLRWCPLPGVGALKSVHEKFSKDVGARIANMDEEEAQEYINDSADDDIALGDLFPALSSSWTFVSIMSDKSQML
jgi:hypothetical protein